MSSQNIKLENSELTAELCYSAFLSLPDIEKKTLLAES